METLSEETWDVVIAGTSLSQSLLALALSKCDLKVLHVDKNDYYGGDDAGLSLDEAEKWVEIQKAQSNNPEGNVFSISKPEASSALKASRAYTISLNPQIVYAKSRFLPSLVSSQIHTQLEFQAVGPFFVLADSKLQKIPSNREDVFADDTLSIRDKRKLMNLLRYVVEDQEQSATPGDQPDDLQTRLQNQFKLPVNLIAPVQALSLSTDMPRNTSFDFAVAKLKRHLMSMGYFGPGLAAVIAKYGGNAEVAQVACRAGAVGGFVYLLGHGLTSAHEIEDELLEVNLTEGTKIKAQYVVGTKDDLPLELMKDNSTSNSTTRIAHNVSIVLSTLQHLFATTSESSNTPAVVIILVSDDANKPPIYLQVHSEDTGECPAGQCVIYASTTHADDESHQRMLAAIDSVLATSDIGDASVLWSMNYITHGPVEQDTDFLVENLKESKVLVFPERVHDLAFDDTTLDQVKAVWEVILGDRSKEYDFLRFDERHDDNDEE